jgi:hypothetical protein
MEKAMGIITTFETYYEMHIIDGMIVPVLWS